MSKIETKECPQCGAPLEANSTTCKYCGAEVNAQPQYQAPQYAPPQAPQYQAPQYAPPQAPPYAPPYAPYANNSSKSKTTAGILAILLGSIGVHKFYLGRPGMGILYILFCWTFIPSIAGLIEGIIYLTSSDERFYSKYVR